MNFENITVSEISQTKKKEQISQDLTYIRYQELANPQRQKLELRLPGTGERGEWEIEWALSLFGMMKKF